MWIPGAAQLWINTCSVLNTAYMLNEVLQKAFSLRRGLLCSKENHACASLNTPNLGNNTPKHLQYSLEL